jgi:hypothetical protein
LFHASESAFALQTRNMVLDWALETRHRRDIPVARGMSALGQKQTCAAQKVMSALPPKADIGAAQINVRFVPIADIAALAGTAIGA